MSLTITRVARMVDLPDVLEKNVRSWPHYSGSKDNPDGYTIPGHVDGNGDFVVYDPLVSEDGERGERRLTGYAEAGTTVEGYRLWVLRFNHWGRETFTYGYMPPSSDSLTVGARDDQDTKTNIETWVDFQLRVDIDAARTAGTVAYNVGRPNEPIRYAEWGRRTPGDPGMEPLLDLWGYYGLGSDRLVRAFREAWEANAEHDRMRASA